MSYRRRQSLDASFADTLSKTQRLAAVSSIRCAPDMGVNRWGASLLCGNIAVGLAFMVRTMAQALDRSNCGIARSRGKEASVKADEPTNRKTIQG
jgi:hypothetical protein